MAGMTLFDHFGAAAAAGASLVAPMMAPGSLPMAMGGLGALGGFGGAAGGWEVPGLPGANMMAASAGGAGRGVRPRGVYESGEGPDRNNWNSDDEDVDEFGRRKRGRPRGRPGGGAEAAAKQAAECRAATVVHESLHIMDGAPPPMDQQLRRIRELKSRPLPEPKREEPDEASMSWLGALQKAHCSDGPPPPPLDEQMRRLQEREDKLKYKKLADFSDEAAYLQYLRQHMQIGMTVMAITGELKGDTGIVVEDDGGDAPKFKWEKYKDADGNSERCEQLLNIELLRLQVQPTSLCDMGCGLPAAPGQGSCCRGCAMAGAHDEQCQRRAMMASAAQQAAQTSFSVEVYRSDWDNSQLILEKLVTAALAAGWTSPLDLISRGNLVMIDARGRVFGGTMPRPRREHLTDDAFPVVLMYKIAEAPGAAAAAPSAAAAASDLGMLLAGSVVPARPGYTTLEPGRNANTGSVVPPRKFQRQEVKPDPALPVFCKFFAAGKCTKGSMCTFTHAVGDLRPTPIEHKRLRPCRFFEEGHCMSGQACIYAHGADEMDEIMRFQAVRQASAGAASMPTGMPLPAGPMAQGQMQPGGCCGLSAAEGMAGPGMPQIVAPTMGGPFFFTGM